MILGWDSEPLAQREAVCRASRRSLGQNPPRSWGFVANRCRRIVDRRNCRRNASRGVSASDRSPLGRPVSALAEARESDSPLCRSRRRPSGTPGTSSSGRDRWSTARDGMRHAARMSSGNGADVRRASRGSRPAAHPSQAQHDAQSPVRGSSGQSSMLVSMTRKPPGRLGGVGTIGVGCSPNRNASGPPTIALRGLSRALMSTAIPTGLRSLPLPIVDCCTMSP